MLEQPETRAALLAQVAADIQALPVAGVRMVAVDGVDGAGKTHFADELGGELQARGRRVVRASADGFHHPAHIRHGRGRSSPDGYYRDSYDYPALVALLLTPLRAGGRRDVVRRIYDVHLELPVARETEHVQPDSVLVFDGIFAHRPELVDFWDYSIWLETPFEVSIPRGAARGHGHPDPASPSNTRYVEGQRLYFAECQPQRRASVVINNEHLAEPKLHRNPEFAPTTED